jgi:hypothetical protein
VATKVFTTNYPSSLDTTTQQPVIVNGDDVDASNVNMLSQIVQELEVQVGSDAIDNYSIKSKNSCIQQKSVKLIYSSVTLINITTWPGMSSTSNFLFQDGYWRHFTGTLTFNPSVTGEGGLDTGTESNNWYYLYLVPKSTNNGLLTVRGSLNRPLIGPIGYSVYKYIGAVKNVSGDLVPFLHVDRNKFYWKKRKTFLTGTVWDPIPVQITLDYVPKTARAVEMSVRLQASGNAWGYGVIYADMGTIITSGNVSIASLVAILTALSSGHGQMRGLVPLIIPQSIYYRKYQGSGTLLSSSFDIHGWIDTSVT